LASDADHDDRHLQPSNGFGHDAQPGPEVRPELIREREHQDITAVVDALHLRHLEPIAVGRDLRVGQRQRLDHGLLEEHVADVGAGEIAHQRGDRITLCGSFPLHTSTLVTRALFLFMRDFSTPTATGPPITRSTIELYPFGSFS
jgi:hypothetical protein